MRPAIRHRGRDRKERHEPAKPRPSPWKAGVLAFAVTWIAVLVRWYPLTRYTVWGSDQGEYGSLLAIYTHSGGQMPASYRGWGGAYADFPGMYSVAAMFSQMTGLDPFLVLSVVIPALAALTALLGFAIALKLTGSLRAATLAGTIIALAMPEAFAGSHGMPGALGGLLALAIVACVVLSVRSPAAKWVGFVLALALVPTHHLSAFLAGVALAGAALLEARFAPGDAARDRIVDSALLSACTLLVLSGIFWAVGAPHFRATVLDRTSPFIASVLPGVAVLGGVALVVLAYYFETRPRSTGRFRAIFDERRTSFRFALAGAGALASLAVVSTAGVPGTSAVVGPGEALVFVPLAFILFAAAAGPGRLAPVRGALVPLGAILGVAASMAIGGALLPTVLLPYRHLQYLVDFAAPLAAVALTFGARALVHVSLPNRQSLHRPVSVALLVLLILSASASTYPTKAALGGFREGTNAEEIGAIVWLQWDVPITLVATDHRLSSLAFGFANHDATWEASAPILLGDTVSAMAALNSTASPSGRTGATMVLLSDDVVAGAALSQWAGAPPIRGAALDKFGSPPFVKLFDNGDAVAYWIAVGARL